MTGWLLGLIGVIFLGVLFDLIYPSGKTNAFCKSIFGVISVIMIISPILNIDFENISEEDLTDTAIIETINNARIDALKSQIVSHLSIKGIDGVDVEIDINVENNDFEVENIYVDTTNLVLTENLTNINKYEVISNEVYNATQIERNRIIVYG